MTSGGARLVDVLASAFAEDPWLRWTLPDMGALRSLMSLFLRTTALPHARVLVAGDPVDGVAIAVPPDVHPPESAEVGAMAVALHGHLIGRALDADAVLDRMRPPDPGWVLHTIGVAPSAQRSGLGGRLLGAVIELSRSDPRPLTLETANPDAVDWYCRRGFVVDHTVELWRGWGLGADAPTVWLLSLRDGPP